VVDGVADEVNRGFAAQLTEQEDTGVSASIHWARAVNDGSANATGKHPLAATRRKFSSHVAPVVWVQLIAARS